MSKTVKVSLIVLLGFSVLIIIFSLTKQIYPISLGIHDPIHTKSDYALSGYDAVAYLTLNKAVKGLEKNTYSYKNVKWRFQSRENLNLFMKNPSKFIPKYGGYCAFAVSKGFTANVDPKVFMIVSRQLFLFSDSEVMHEWRENLDQEIIDKSDLNWGL